LITRPGCRGDAGHQCPSAIAAWRNACPAHEAAGRAPPFVDHPEGVYDRHRYIDEKRQAFEELAAQVDRILNPNDNVIPMNAGAG